MPHRRFQLPPALRLWRDPMARQAPVESLKGALSEELHPSEAGFTLHRAGVASKKIKHRRLRGSSADFKKFYRDLGQF
jgi:hypothetical protein